METQEEASTVVESDIQDFDYDSDEGDPNGWVLSYIIDMFHMTPIMDGTIFDKIKKKKLPPLNSNGLIQLMEAMNEKSQLNFSEHTGRTRNQCTSCLLRKLKI